MNYCSANDNSGLFPKRQSRAPSADLVKSWFPSKWFTPSDDEAENFAEFLRGFYFRSLEEALCRKSGIAEFPPWHAAVDVLIRDLPAAILEHLRIEQETFGNVEPGGAGLGLASSLAALLLAAQKARIPSVRRAYATGVPWHDYATQIASHIICMARRAGRSESISHPEAGVIVVTKLALDACGYHTLGADAIVQMFKRSSFKPP